jgi:hypothetical protein
MRDDEGGSEHVPLAPESYKPHYYFSRTGALASALWCLVSGFVFPPEWRLVGGSRCVSREHSRLETSWMAGSRTGSWNVGGCAPGISKSTEQPTAAGLVCGPSVSLCRARCGAPDLDGAVAVAVAVAIAIAILCASCRLRGSSATLSQAATAGVPGVCNGDRRYAMLSSFAGYGSLGSNRRRCLSAAESCRSVFAVERQDPKSNQSARSQCGTGQKKHKKAKTLK